MGMGHGGAAMSVIALLLSTAFLVWIAAQVGNPMKKFGTIVGWIALVFSALLIIGGMGRCYYMNKTYGCAMLGNKPGMTRGMGMGRQMMMNQMMQQQDQQK